MSGQAPPWSGKKAEPERTPDGRPIIRTPHGPHVDRGDGYLVLYRTAEEEWHRRFGQAGLRPAQYRADTSFSAWTA